MERVETESTEALPGDEERKRAVATGMSLALWARYQPDVPAIISKRGTRSFAELNAGANRVARALRARGLRAGDSIALLASNRPEFCEVIYAAQRAGLRCTPVNWHLTAEEAAYIVNDCNARALIGDVRFAETCAQTARLCPNLEARFAIGAESDNGVEGFDAYARVLTAEDGADIEDPVLGSRMLYTSGTTGRPKGVAHQRRAARRTMTEKVAAYGPGKGQLHLCTGPLYHAAPLGISVLPPLAAGVGVVLMDKWDAEETLQLIHDHRATHTHMVPTMFHRMLRLPAEVRQRYDVSSMQFIVHGAAPCPVATKRALIDWFGPIVWEYYAATEGSGTVVGSEEWLKKPGTVGKPPSEDHILVYDETGELCPPGQAGTLYLKLPEGGGFEYHKDPDKTEKARRGSHFTLGDVGYLDDDGYLFLTDRSAHLIISGGVNIYPAEIEALLLSHPAVHDVGVIGVANPDWGEEVKAVVEVSADAEPGDALGEQLMAFCREHLAHFKCPRSVDFTEALPRHDNGKLYKHKLREQYRAASA